MKHIRYLLVLCLAFALGAFCLSGCAKNLQNEDVVGIWKTTSENSEDLQEQGIYTFYHFNEDGTFTLDGWIQGSNLQRVGTWGIQDNKVIINVPEGESFDTGVISGDAPAIENGEITIEDNTLNTDAIGDQHVTATKISEDDYNAAVEDSKAKGPKAISVGEAVETDLYSFTIDSIDYAEEIYPSDTSGYYYYMTDESGSSYLVARISFKNLSSDYMVPSYAIAANYSINGNNYNATVALDIDAKISQSYQVEAKDTASMVIYASVPDEVKNSGTTTLTISMPKSIDMFQTYASYVSDPQQYSITL